MDREPELPVAVDEEMLDDEDEDDCYYGYSDMGEGDEDEEEGSGSEEELAAGDYLGQEAEGSDDDIVSRREQRYIVLTEKDISERQEEDITDVSGLLMISREEAYALLYHYKWNISRLNDEWFSNEQNVRDVVGLPSTENIYKSRKLTCGICFERFSADVMSSASCNHFYCHECWEGFISAAIGDGPGCLSLRCPDPSCSAMVLQGMINKLAKDDDKEKYERFALRAYVEDRKKTKWCPAPDCTCAVEFLGDGNYDVSCKCKFNFCWNCTEEAHRPVNCKTVSMWILKNSAESENMNWILANSKPCPKCKRPIEKNQGCMHMTCTPPCKFEFCWLCLGSWAEHGERTGGFYACNRYESAKKEGIYDETESRRDRAKNSLSRYMHYYERWASNQTSRQKAQADLEKADKEHLAKLNAVLGIPETQLKFITDAWSQIIECRRVLKWTYAYGYYLEEKAKTDFFEYLQGEAESALERLHQAAEKDLQAFLPSPKSDNNEPHASLTEFGDFRVKLAGLTSITRNYFENLVQVLEAGLVDVHATSQAAAAATSSSATTSKKASATGKTAKKPRSGSSSDHPDDTWTCERCKCPNPSSEDECTACSKHRR